MSKTVEIKAHAGVRNDVSTERYTTNDLLVGNNVDVDETGKLYRRLGRTLVSSGDTSSLWSDKQRAFYVRSGTLYQLLPDMSTHAVATGVGTHVAYESLGEAVYWTDGVQSGRVQDGQNHKWGIEVPKNTFTVAQTTGDLQPGLYTITLVYLRNGTESGAPRGKQIELSVTGGITISNIPQPTSSDVNGIAVYMTRTNGETPYRAAILQVGTTSASIYALPVDELPLRTQFMGPPPAGQLIGFYAGRAWIGQGNVLWYTEPFEYELVDYRNNYIQFEKNVTIFAPVKDGVFVATEDETVFFHGLDPTGFEADKPLPFGGVLGTLVTPLSNFVTREGVPDASQMWTSTLGVCVGVTGGQLVQLTSNRYIMPTVKRGSGLFKIRGGTPQYVSSLFS